jgi:hypothetical protein
MGQGARATSVPEAEERAQAAPLAGMARPSSHVDWRVAGEKWLQPRLSGRDTLSKG